MYIREANIGDVDQVVQLVNSGYWSKQKAFFQEGPESLRTNTQEVSSLINDQNKKLYLLIDEVEKIAGSILYDPTGSFGLFTIASEGKYRGMGERLITFIENKAREDHKTLMTIEVLNIADKLVGYYNRLGYQPTGESHPFSQVSQARLREEYDERGVQYLVLQKSL